MSYPRMRYRLIEVTEYSLNIFSDANMSTLANVNINSCQQLFCNLLNQSIQTNQSLIKLIVRNKQN